MSRSEDGTEGRKRTKDDDGDVDGAEDAELVGLFEEAGLALRVRSERDYFCKRLGAGHLP